MVLGARSHSNCLLLVASDQRAQRLLAEMQVQAPEKAVADHGRLLSHVGVGLLGTQGGSGTIGLLLSVFILVDM